MKSFKTFNEGYASNDPKVKAIAKKFKKEIQAVRKGKNSGPWINQGRTVPANYQKLYDAVYAYLSNSERGNWDDPDFADEQIDDFVFDTSKFGLGKV